MKLANVTTYICNVCKTETVTPSGWAEIGGCIDTHLCYSCVHNFESLEAWLKVLGIRVFFELSAEWHYIFGEAITEQKMVSIKLKDVLQAPEGGVFLEVLEPHWVS